MTVEARLLPPKQPAPYAYRALCGAEARGLVCQLSRDDRGAWYLSHPRGLYWDEKAQMYRTLKIGKLPRRPVPLSMRVGLGYKTGQNSTNGPRMAIEGERPSPPCTVACPSCSEPNIVPVPPPTS